MGVPERISCEVMLPDAEGWSDWVHPLPGYLIQCCDCGLVHEMEFQIGEQDGDGPLNPGEGPNGVVIFRARRADDVAHWSARAQNDLGAVVEEFRAKLRGWWYSFGECSVSADASCGPDRNGAEAALLADKLFDGGFHADLGHPATLADALRNVMEQGLAARGAADIKDA